MIHSKQYKLINDDCLHYLESLDDNSIDLVVTSPPYNIGKEYEKDNLLPMDDYIKWQCDLFKQCLRVIKPSGSICWQVGTYLDKKTKDNFPLDYMLFNDFYKLGGKLKNKIIWQFNAGFVNKYRFSGRHETVMWFTKTDNYKFNLDPVRVPSIWAGIDKRVNSKGKNPTNYWEINGDNEVEFLASDSFFDNTVWKLPAVTKGHKEKTLHPCQFPLELVERCVLALTDKGDTVLDIFNGSGTSVIAAIKHDRFGIGVDKSSEYLEITKSRIDKFLNGELNYRAFGKTILTPEQFKNRKNIK